MQFFSSDKHLQEMFFQNHPPPPPSRVKWSAPYSPSIFLASTQTAPRPLSSFGTHARWQLVTQSARSRRSYGKIEDCEQSMIYCDNNTKYLGHDSQWAIFEIVASLE